MRRLLSAVFALWFAIVLGDPGVLHACPEHGAHSAHAPATGHSTHQSGVAHGGQHQQQTGGCTCVGCCCAAPALARLPHAATFAVSAKIVVARAQTADCSDAPSSSPDRLLPFANGPPQV